MTRRTEMRWVVVTDNEEQTLKAVEQFGRVAVGLALDGIVVETVMGPPERIESVLEDEEAENGDSDDVG